MTCGFPTAQPMRQPVMLKDLEREWNSMATSIAPAISKMLCGASSKVDFAVGEIVGDDPVVFLGELDGFFVEGERGGGGGGIVGIVEPDEFGFLFDLFGDGVEVGEEVVFFEEGHEVGDAAGENGAGVVDGVAGLGDEDDFARVDDRQRQVRDAVFGADGGEDGFVGVERRR